MNTKVQTFVLPFLLISLVFLLYSPTYHAEFHFDDYAYILESQNVLDLQAVLNQLKNNFFRPDRSLVALSFAINHKIHGFSVPGYHLVNISTHALNGVLVYCLLFLLLESGNTNANSAERKQYSLVAFCSAALFLVHPVAVNSVTYITQRHVLLTTSFYLSGIIAYIYGRNRNGGKHLFWYAACLFCFWGAIHCKPMALTFPFALIAYEFIFIQPFREISRRMLVVFFALLLSCIGLLSAYAVSAGIFSSDALLAGFRSKHLWSPWEHFLTEAVVFCHYWRILFLPLPFWLSGDHFFPIIKSINGAVALSLALHLLIFGAAFHLFVKKRLLLAFGFCWFYLTLAPPYLVLPIQDVKVEYKTYLASFGYICIIATVLLMLVKRLGNVAAILLFVFILTGSATLTVERNRVFQTEVSLWSDVISKYPDNPRAYNNRGLAHHRQGEYDLAIADFQKAINREGGYTMAYANIGDSYSKIGELQKALNYYLLYSNTHPQDPDGFVRIANAYAKLNQLDKSIIFYDKALKRAPSHPSALYNQGLAYGKLGSYEQAKACFEAILQTTPTHSKALTGLGATYSKLGDPEQAIIYFKKSLTLDPFSPDTLYNLAVCQAKGGDMNSAIQTAQQLKQIAPERGEKLLRVLKQ